MADRGRHILGEARQVVIAETPWWVTAAVVASSLATILMFFGYGARRKS